MAMIAVLGATGALGAHVTARAIASGLGVRVLVRSPGRLRADLRERVEVVRADLAAIAPHELGEALAGCDAAIMCAGHSADGDAFVALFDRVATGVESMPSPPVCWFLAGAGLLDIGDSGRRGVDLPVMRGKFAPHRLNFQRLQRSQLDWRLLCPGPMVEGEGLGLARLRIARERLPVEIPSFARLLPSPLLLPVLARRIPEMIVPYEDAAALMLAHLAPGGEFSRARVGIALPAGMRGRKDGWTKPPQ